MVSLGNSELNPPIHIMISVDIVWVNIGSGNGLVPDGTKPLPEPVLIYHCLMIWYLHKQFHRSAQDINSWNEF